VSPLPLVARWRRAVLASDLTRGQKIVAMALAEHMNGEGGSCYPSVKTLASETGLSVRGVRKAIAELSRRKWISRKRGGSRPGHTSRYQALLLGLSPGSASRGTEVPLTMNDGSTPGEPEFTRSSQRSSHRGRSLPTTLGEERDLDRFAYLDQMGTSFAEDEETSG
jgi:DNA-binding transcriptional MocR family regulator